VALADDFFTAAVDPPGEGATDEDLSESQTLAADVEDDDSLSPQRRSRPGRARKTVEQEGQLARMVRELREVEDEIASKLALTDRLLAQLESRGVHEDGGYASADEFEQRMLASTPTLRAMRETFPQSPQGAESTSGRAKLTLARREPHDARARKTKALTSIARALDRIRKVDSEIHRAASLARIKLCAIERMRVYEECGYASFEEFLERALGPSPVLSAAVALLADEPLPPPGVDRDALDTASTFLSGPADDTRGFSPSLFTNDMASADDPRGDPGDTASIDAVAAPPESAKVKPPPSAIPGAAASPAPAKRKRTGIVLSVVFCALATIVGAAAGVWSGRFTAVTPPPPAAAAVLASPAAPTVALAPQSAHAPAAAAPPAAAQAKAPRDQRD
jgi:hypothetical protein